MTSPKAKFNYFGPRPNATIPRDGELQVRVGIPKPGGALMAEAVNSDYPVMVSASAFYRNGRLCPADFIRGGEIFMADVALDSAGFTAMLNWAKKGQQTGMANTYAWTLPEYTDLVASLRSACSWWAQPDFCVEEAIAPNQEERRRRIELTAMSLSYCLQETQFHEVLAEREFSHIKSRLRRRILTLNNSIRPPVPVLQGWDVDDYRYSAELLLHAWEPWKEMYSCDLIGLGSVCRRHLHDKRHGILAILRGIEEFIPKGSKLHLFGVKGVALQALKDHPLVASADSMSYDYAARMSAAKAGVSNAMAGRIVAMHAWMRRHTDFTRDQPDLFRRG